MKYIYFVRHGESRANTGEVGVGSDPSLSQKGREQAAMLAKRCGRLPIELIISSTMNRAKETTEIIRTNVDKPIEVSDLFVERRLPSKFDGLLEEKWFEMRKTIKGFFYEPGFHHSDEENFEDILIRSNKALELLESKAEKHIVVVTHGSFLRDMLAVALFKENLTAALRRSMTKGFMTNNTGLTLVEYDESSDQWSMITWNDHAHLG